MGVVLMVRLRGGGCHLVRKVRRNLKLETPFETVIITDTGRISCSKPFLYKSCVSSEIKDDKSPIRVKRRGVTRSLQIAPGEVVIIDLENHILCVKLS